MVTKSQLTEHPECRSAADPDDRSQLPRQRSSLRAHKSKPDRRNGNADGSRSVRVSAETYQEIRRLVAKARHKGWLEFGLNRCDLPSVASLVNAAVELLAHRANAPIARTRTERLGSDRLDKLLEKETASLPQAAP
jgi:hypothetical protein